MLAPEAFRRLIPSLPPAASSTVTQKPKNKSPEHMDVVAHGALSPPLSAASGASCAAEDMKSVRAGCPARSHLIVLINTHYTGLRS